MEILCRLMFAICFFTMFKAGVAQYLTEVTSKDSNCFGGILKGNCSDTNDRAFVKQINAGVKYLDRYNATLCTPYWTSTIPQECCVQESNDCYGEYSVVANNSYSYHEDCIGKNKCAQRLATQMDTLYLTSCDHNLYPAQTTYMDVEFYCIDVNNITPLNNGNKQNNGQGSTLYLWSGDSSTYSELMAATHTCSVETDCDGEISVLSMDFRFADDNMNLTCIEDNVLTVTDGSNTNNFTCSSNNNFEINPLYTSSSNYITVTYTGTTAGGYLWLGFQTSTNGNLTINCQSPGQIHTCETSTTEEPTTTEQQTTTDEITTTSLQSTTDETTTGSLTSTEDQTFTTDNSSTTTDKVTNGKSESPSPGNNTGMIAGIVVAIIIIIAIVIGVYLRHRKKQASTGNNPEEQPHASENSVKKSNGENVIVSEETQGGSSMVLSNDNEVNREINMVNNGHLPIELTGPGTSLTQLPLPPITAKLTQDQSESNEKIKKKKKKKKRNKVDDNGSEIQGNGVLQGSGADIKNIDENGEHSRKRKKKKKKTKRQENSAELNEQEYFEETPELKEKKKKKKKRKEKQREDSNQEEENTITTLTIEKENDPE